MNNININLIRNLSLVITYIETLKFHENQVFQQLQQLKIWIRGHKKEEKQSLHSSMRHFALICCIILQSIIKIFEIVTELREMK